MCLFLRARALDNFFLRAASTLLKLQMASSEHIRNIQMAGSKHFDYFELLRKFSASRNLSFIKRNVVLQQVTVNNRAQTSKSEQ